MIATALKRDESALSADDRDVHILIVDDNAADRDYCKHLFAKVSGRRHYTIVEAANAEDGIRHIENHRPDCVLLDYMMPDASGLDVLNRLKEKFPSLNMAFVMVTGCGDEKIAVEAMKHGAIDYIGKKNLTAEALERAVMNAIEKSELQRLITHHRDELERSNRELADFCHVVSHDLKAPLRKIASFCDLLQKSAHVKMDEESAHYIDRLSANSRRVQQLVQDLLTFSKVMNTKEPVEAVDLKSLVSDVIEDLQVVIDENSADIRIDGDLPVVNGMALRLRQLFQNLIANAIKFKSDAPPRVLIRAVAKDQEWEISIADNGIGIEPEYQERIFDAFTRLHSQNEYEGSGIGLSICKRVVDMHRGKIWVTSQLGQGSTFFFTLPCRLAPAGDTA